MNKYKYNWKKYVILLGCCTSYLIGGYIGKMGWEKIGKTLDVMIRGNLI